MLLCFRRELLNGNAFIPHIYHGDNHFIATLIFDNYSTICLSLDEALYLRRVRNDSIMTSKKINEAHHWIFNMHR